MHRGSGPTPLQLYLATADALEAEPWHLLAMAAVQWPPGYEPAPGFYERMRAQLVAGYEPVKRSL